MPRGKGKGAQGNGREGGAAASPVDSIVKLKRFEAEEDKLIREHVKKHGPSMWAELSEQLQRPGAAIAQRWRNVLDPALNKEVGGQQKRFMPLVLCRNNINGQCHLINGVDNYL